MSLGLVSAVQTRHGTVFWEPSVAKPGPSTLSSTLYSLSMLETTNLILDFIFAAQSSLDAPIVQLQWIGKDDRYVFALTERKTLWRSTDGGGAFTNMTSKLSAGNEEDGRGDVVQIIQDTDNPQNVLFVGSGSYFWATNDYGETVHAKQTPSNWKGMRIYTRVHPYNSNWVLAIVRRPNCEVRTRFWK